jgi:hypothetical protein
METEQKSARSRTGDILTRVFQDPGLSEAAETMREMHSRFKKRPGRLPLPESESEVASPEASAVVSPAVRPPVSPAVKKEEVVSPADRPPVSPGVSTVVSGEASTEVRTVVSPAASFSSEMWHPFTEKQGTILLYLIQAGGTTKRQAIVDSTGIKLSSVKYSLPVLIEEGYVSQTVQVNTHNYQGFSYSIDVQKCYEYFTRFKPAEEWPLVWTAGQSVVSPAASRVVRPVVSAPVSPAASPPSPTSSSSKNLTTKEQGKLCLEDGTDLWITPEMRYWKAAGLDDGQIRLWMQEFNKDLDLLVENLKYCRFEMVELNMEEKKEIRSPVDWFYKILVRRGYYPRPKDFRSMSEIEVEERQRILEERAAERERMRQLEVEEKFQDMLDDPEGELYRQCFSSLNDFARKSKGKLFESAMREAFNTICCDA